MSRMQCTHCSASVPAAARYCPRCGHEVGNGAAARTNAPVRAADALPSSSRMPLAGILFLAAAVLGPTMIAVGVSTSTPLLLVTGIVVAALLIVLLLVGMIF